MLKNLLLAAGLTLTPAAALILGAAPAAAAEVAGVDVPGTVTAEGKTLKLNGVGIRKKLIIKVYVGALYLESTTTDANTAISSDQVKQVVMTFKRDVPKEKIIGAYHDGFENNSKDKLGELQAGLDKLSAGLADMKEGGVMTFTYAPGKGSTIAIAGGPSVTIEGKTFGEALMRNWLGDEPADSSLKEDMLSGH